MKERPILFSGAMVRAILEGRKTVTRREAKPVKHPDLGNIYTPGALVLEQEPQHVIERACPYGQPGDRLWVRETWTDVNMCGAPALAYRADDEVRDLMAEELFLDEDGAFNYQDQRWKKYPFCDWYADLHLARWRPSIHMPRWASRILLEITAVRVERLQDGDGETAFESRYLAEGIHRIHQGDGEFAFHPFKTEPGPGSWTDPFDAWRELWVSVNGGDSWNANPWVWVVEFKVREVERG